MVFIYVLKLQNNKYYVGKTTQLDFRINDHFNANGAKWTQLHKPIEIDMVIPNCDDYDEDKYTIKYMSKYGIENVRGGSFCKITLTNSELQLINQMIKGAADRCYKCGGAGHFASKCYNNADFHVNKPAKKTNFITSIFSGLTKILSDDTCDRCGCGREGHHDDECYAKYHIDGGAL